jgi:hypothetical protein
MTHLLVARTVPADDAARSRQRRARIGAVAGGVALLIAAGGYEAARTASPALHPPTLRSGTGASVQPGRAVMQDLRASVPAQYRTRAPEPARAGSAHTQAAGTEVRPGRVAMRELHISIARQYGGRH